MAIISNYTALHYSSLRDYWIEITKSEFQKAWNKITTELYNQELKLKYKKEK